MGNGSGDMAVRWTALDAVVAFFSPSAARSRFQQRVAIANLRRAYDGAKKDGGREGWRAGGTSADAEIASNAAILRHRMRDLVRNDPLAAQAVQVLVSNVIGTGIRPRAATPDPALNRLVDEAFKRWSERCDADGHTDFHGLTALAFREMVEAGDIFAQRIRRRASERMPVPCQVQLKEIDHLDTAKFDARPDGSRIVQGIEYDSQGRRRKYWMFPDHPGDSWPVHTRRLESVAIDAAGIAHLFERQRVQNRGVPWGAPAVGSLRDFGNWTNAELRRKQMEACVVGVVFGAEEDQQSVAPVIEDADGNAVESFEPGLIAYARGGKDIKFNQPAATGGIGEWARTQQHVIAAGFRVPYSLVTGDLSQVNFSSSRVGLNEFRRMVEALQWHTVIPMFCAPLWRWFTEAAWTAGAIPAADIPVEWAPPAFESVNPLQDAQADLLETRAGYRTLAQQIAKRGYDPREVLTEWAATAALVDELGLVLDSDPRRITKAGQSQQGDDQSRDRAPPDER